jgi:HEPN domain-containing protein
LPRKTDSNNPADWLYIADLDLAGLKALATQELGYEMCRSKLAEVLEKVVKAELIRLGWPLVKTHDLQVLAKELQARKSDLLPIAKPLCNALAEVYFTDRYPGFELEEPDWPKLRQQIEPVAGLAEAVKAQLGKRA